jgi:hypothetical protein
MITIIMILLASLVFVQNWNNNRSQAKLKAVLSDVSLRKSKDHRIYIVRRGVVLCSTRRFAAI